MDDDALLRSIPAVMARLPKMTRQELVTVWCHAVEVRSSDTLLQSAIARLLDAVDAAFASPAHRARLEPLDEGPLALLGYHAGHSAGLSARRRQARLSAIYRRPIPPVFPPHYLASWGEPGTPIRLERMAYMIASFIHDPRRRKDPRLEDAIGDWKDDLVFLQRTHYGGEFRWPDV